MPVVILALASAWLPLALCTPQCGWTDWWRERGSVKGDLASAVAVNQDGEIFIAGSAEDSLDGQTSEGDRDFMLMKFLPNGTWQWTRLGGYSGVDSVAAIALDTAGNIFMAGYTTRRLDGQRVRGEWAYSDVALVKYSALGKREWIKRHGSPEWDYAHALAVNSMGDIFVAGFTWGRVDGATNMGNNDILLMKFDFNGDWKWSKEYGSNESDYAEALVLDADGDILIAGYTQGSMDNIFHAGSDDMFVMKLSANGTKMWTQQHGTVGRDQAKALAVDPDGHIFVTGHTEGSLHEAKSAGDHDIFLMKFSPDGVRQWTQQRGTSAFENAFAIAMNPSGDVFVAGKTRLSMDGQAVAGDFDAVLVKFAAGETWEWTRQFGTSKVDVAKALAISPRGDIVVAGDTWGAVGGQPYGGLGDIFVAKIKDSCDGPPLTSGAGGKASDVAFAVLLVASLVAPSLRLVRA